jgi:hypothetical protein
MPSFELVVPWAVVLLVFAASVTLFARRSALGDSPWYWVAIFSMAAAAALFVMDRKYGRRQDHLENEYRYGTRSLAPQEAKPQAEATTTPTSDLGSTSSPQAGSPTSDRIISLWPLRIAAVSATLISLVMLIRRSRAPAKVGECSST